MPNIHRMMMAASSGSLYDPALYGTGYKLFSWGRNHKGQLGLGNTTDISSPVQIGPLDAWKDISGGFYSFSAIRSDGTLWVWGNNDNGQLGLGTKTDVCVPTQVGTLTDWRKVYIGEYQSMGFKTDGTFWTWGSGSDGGLGRGSKTSTCSPIQIGSLTDWSSSTWANGWIGQHMMGVIKPNGTLWTWGAGDHGGTGHDDTDHRCSPTQVGSSTDWFRGHASNGRASVLIDTSGDMWACGQNNGPIPGGRLGFNNNIAYSTLTQTGNSTDDWKNDHIDDLINPGESAFGGCIYWVKDDGSLWATGFGHSGRLGTGSTSDVGSFTQIGALTTWKRTANNYASGGATTTSNKLFLWGNGDYGEMGDGGTSDRSSPVQLGALDWQAVTGCREAFLGLQG